MSTLTLLAAARAVTKTWDAGLYLLAADIATLRAAIERAEQQAAEKFMAEYDAGQHQPTEADKAALEKTKPKLMADVKAILEQAAKPTDEELYQFYRNTCHSRQVGFTEFKKNYFAEEAAKPQEWALRAAEEIKTRTSPSRSIRLSDAQVAAIIQRHAPSMDRDDCMKVMLTNERHKALLKSETMERELAEALRDLHNTSHGPHRDDPIGEAKYEAAQEETRAVLARFDAKQKP